MGRHKFSKVCQRWNAAGVSEHARVVWSGCAAFDVVAEQMRISDCAASTFFDMRVQGQVKSPGYASILFHDELFDQARRGGEKAWKMCFKQNVAYLRLSSSPAQLDALRKLSEKI